MHSCPDCGALCDCEELRSLYQCTHECENEPAEEERASP